MDEREDRRLVTVKQLGKNESGQGALAIVLMLLMLGAIILTPLLVFMNTGLKTGQVYESKLQEFYAADAGVEDGLWQIKYGDLGQKFSNPAYNPYDYYTNYTYNLPHEINNKSVTVNITNVWIPYGISCPTPQEARSIIESGTLIVTGNVISYTSGQQGYQIRVSYFWQGDDPNGTKLGIATIGAWLSGGFNYTSGSGNLSSYTSSCAPYCGGQAITWNLNNQTFKLSGQTGYPLVRTFNFNFTGPADQNPQAVSWITTTGVSAIPYSWDADTKPYRITSTAGSTTAEAYVIKNELRKLGAAISGDYVAVGNTLMDCTRGSEYRNQLYMETSAVINPSDIPATATIDAAFLYWTGWIDCYCSSITYPKNPTPKNLTTLVETNASVNKVMFGITNNMTEITTHEWEADENIEHAGTWSYSCFYDVTDLVKGFIAAGEVGKNSAGTYIVGHAVVAPRTGYPEYYFTLYPTAKKTGYPLGTPSMSSRDSKYDWAYAGWSLIIIYSSPETKGHQLYLYDKFAYAAEDSDVDFDDDGNPGGTISGFLAPKEIETENYAAKLTCFVGEGDQRYAGDFIAINAPASYWIKPATIPDSYKLWDGTASDSLNNVWNEKSLGVSISGTDIDTFTVPYPTIKPGDTTARIDMPTKTDSWNLVYIILSFRSSITTGGTISYLIRG